MHPVSKILCLIEKSEDFVEKIGYCLITSPLIKALVFQNLLRSNLDKKYRGNLFVFDEFILILILH